MPQNDIKKTYKSNQFRHENVVSNELMAVEFRGNDPTDLTDNPMRVWARTDTDEVLYTVDGVTVNTMAKKEDLINTNGKVETLFINALYPPVGCPPFKRHNTSYDNSVALQWIVDNLSSLNTVHLFFPEGPWEFKTKVLITASTSRHLEIEGICNASSGDNGTELDYSGIGEFIQLSEDDGQPWDSNSYNGVGNLTIRKAFIVQTAANTNLLCGTGKYKPGSYGIRDWRGGDIVLEDVTLQGFEFGFWGIQSDINYFRKVTARYNKVALFMGPRSDQFTCETLYAYSNDTVLQLDGISGARFNNCQIVANGSTTTVPISIGSNLRACNQIVFNSPWFENFVINGVPSFIDIGIVGTVLQGLVTVNDPQIITSSALTTSFMRLNKAQNVMINNVGALPAGSFSSFIKYSGLTPDVTFLALFNGYGTPANFIDKTGATGSIRAATWTSEFGVPQIGSLNYDRWAFAGTQSARYFEFARPGTHQWQLTLNNDPSTNKTLLDISRRIVHSAAIPTTGEYQRGDMALNTMPAEIGTAGSKYVILGWSRLTNGTTHVLNTDWVEIRTPTGN